eukprot:TRINITY_DN5717_c0_g1_i1.p1 TRINITY_DN5717_c0_g1~~TRINITY_DN5717_c0_g1_i1.p1  ORF type:complete len:186 (+),score=35.70 TRINITY_DN5717_c0_g1_i1:62-559(+)
MCIRDRYQRRVHGESICKHIEMISLSQREEENTIERPSSPTNRLPAPVFQLSVTEEPINLLQNENSSTRGWRSSRLAETLHSREEQPVVMNLAVAFQELRPSIEEERRVPIRSPSPNEFHRVLHHSFSNLGLKGIAIVVPPEEMISLRYIHDHNLHRFTREISAQ